MPLIETFFNQGGLELQINCFDAETLRSAQRNPENYKDLVVRVAGFSARFIDLSKLEQEELIARAGSIMDGGIYFEKLNRRSSKF